MLSSPSPGTRVRLHYSAAYRSIGCPHGAHGVVLVRGTGRPRNHLVLLDDGTRTVVPAGNMVKEEE